MPAPFELRLETVGDSVVVSYGGRALACYERGDRGMRNLAIVSLTRAGVSCVEVGRLFGMRPEHVSRLRRQVAEGGSRALLPAMGRPRKLDRGEVARAYELAERGVAGAEIAERMGVSGATISRLLARRPAREVDCLPLSEAIATDTGGEFEEGSQLERDPLSGPGLVGDSGMSDVIDPVDPVDPSTASDWVSEDVAPAARRIGEGGGRSVYAGAMLLHPFLEKVGAGDVFSVLSSGPARCYDTTSVALSSVFAFALGSSSLEGSKHLLLADAGLLAGSERFPHLRTLRPRLGLLADAVDPLAVQLTLAKAMLAADREPPSVFFVDGHFVAYTGLRPVAKGWNTRRRHAEPGREETVVVDDRWRAVCFSSGPPEGLCKGMLSPLDQLQAICAGRRVMVGFDRGGSYPKAFSAVRERGFDWVTYRRAPLATPTVKPRASWVEIDGRRHYLRVADEIVELEGYGPARQITVYEHGRVALQILTSDLTTPAARLAHVLRCRWCIENTFKYVEDHNGYHWLAGAHRARGAVIGTRRRRRAAPATLVDLERRVYRERLVGGVPVGDAERWTDHLRQLSCTRPRPDGEEQASPLRRHEIVAGGRADGRCALLMMTAR